MDLCDLSVPELAGMLRKREISSREITESVFKRIDEKEETINAFITTTRETARKQADQADCRFRDVKKVPLLNGIPVAIKDILCTQGIKTTCGSNILNNYIPTYPGTTYEATLVYLIRRKDKLEIYSDRHILGLFKLEKWLDLLKTAGFDIINQISMDHTYDRFLIGEGKYPRLMFVCRKRF